MKRPEMWWTTVKGSRRSRRRPWRFRDPTPRPVKIADERADDVFELAVLASEASEDEDD